MCVRLTTRTHQLSFRAKWLTAQWVDVSGIIKISSEMVYDKKMITLSSLQYENVIIFCWNHLSTAICCTFWHKISRKCHSGRRQLWQRAPGTKQQTKIHATPYRASTHPDITRQVSKSPHTTSGVDDFYFSVLVSIRINNSILIFDFVYLLFNIRMAATELW